MQAIDRANSALADYASNSGSGYREDTHTTIADLLADLMHVAQAQGIEFDDALRIARDNFDAERI